MNLLRRLQCLLFGHVPTIVYEISDKRFGTMVYELSDKRFGRVDLWLCECCGVYYKEKP